jgi:hypothetical protein
VPNCLGGTAGALPAPGFGGLIPGLGGGRSAVRVCHAPLTAQPSAYAGLFLFHSPLGRNRPAQQRPSSFRPQRRPQRGSRLSTSNRPTVNNLAGLVHSIIPRPGETRVDGSRRPCHRACARGLREGKGPRSVRGRQSAIQRPNGDLVLIGQRKWHRQPACHGDGIRDCPLGAPSSKAVDERADLRKPGIQRAGSRLE